MSKKFYEVRRYIDDESGLYISKYFQTFEAANQVCEEKIKEWYQIGALDSEYNGQIISCPLEEHLRRWREIDNYHVYGWIGIFECCFED